jgi:hypothetical protein
MAMHEDGLDNIPADAPDCGEVKARAMILENRTTMVQELGGDCDTFVRGTLGEWRGFQFMDDPAKPTSSLGAVINDPNAPRK